MSKQKIIFENMEFQKSSSIRDGIQYTIYQTNPKLKPSLKHIEIYAINYSDKEGVTLGLMKMINTCMKEGYTIHDVVYPPDKIWIAKFWAEKS